MGVTQAARGVLQLVSSHEVPIICCCHSFGNYIDFKKEFQLISVVYKIEIQNSSPCLKL